MSESFIEYVDKLSIPEQIGELACQIDDLTETWNCLLLVSARVDAAEPFMSPEEQEYEAACIAELKRVLTVIAAAAAELPKD